MKNTVNLHLLSMVANNYPGVATDINLVCGGNKATFTPGYIIYDTVPGPLAVSFTQDVDLVNAAIVEGSAWKVATKIIDCLGATKIVSEPFFDVIAAAQACCGSSIPVGAFVFKVSPFALTPGGTYPCAAPAAFKWMSTIPADDPATYNVKFIAILKDSANANAMTILLSDFAPDQDTVQVNSLTLNWANDFIGKTDGVKTLVANTVTAPGANDRLVSFYDGGTITVRTLVSKLVGEDLVPVADTQQIFALPASLCACNIICNWSHTGNDNGNGLITVNGDTVVDSNATGEAGQFIVHPGDSITATASISSTCVVDVDSSVSGDLDPETDTFTWAPVCGHVYTITLQTNTGE
jgi:hypothetical protein